MIEEADSDAVELSPEAVIDAAYSGGPIADGQSPLVVKLQVLLDRLGFSPGVIDGYMGENVTKALSALETATGLRSDGTLDDEAWRILANDEQPVLQPYRITEDDLSTSFTPDLPSDYGALADLDRLGYSTPREMFAERFHMDEDLLAALNPGADFGSPGSEIIVAFVGHPISGPPVTRIVTDKTLGQLVAYDADRQIVVAYPATIGSEDLPSPSGTHTVEAIAPEADYYYRPSETFQQGDNTEPLTIAPGPNNPIGTTWIDLSEPTYGIHGTPEPAEIDKTASHGCVRLTNWDVEELANLIEPGVTVEFR